MGQDRERKLNTIQPGTRELKKTNRTRINAETARRNADLTENNSRGSFRGRYLPSLRALLTYRHPEGVTCCHPEGGARRISKSHDFKTGILRSPRLPQNDKESRLGTTGRKAPRNGNRVMGSPGMAKREGSFNREQTGHEIFFSRCKQC